MSAGPETLGSQAPRTPLETAEEVSFVRLLKNAQMQGPRNPEE
jgi:hypothetical protein